MEFELHVGKWPDRKLPILTVLDVGTNEHQILATFRSQAAADKFMEIAAHGIKKKEEPR